MKRVFGVLLMLVMLTNLFTFAISAEEKSGVCGEDLTWVLDNDGTLTISGTGEMYDFDIVGPGSPITDGRHISPWDYRELVNKVVIEDGVTSVGSNAFNCLDSITEVVLPNSLRSIGDYAFAMCSSLQKISFPPSVMEFGCWAFSDTLLLKTAFANNDGGLYINDILVQVDMSYEGEFRIKDGTKSICPYAFWTSWKIESIVIPSSVEFLTGASFNSIMNLKQIIIDEDNPYYFVEDGVIFSTDKTELVYCLITKEGEYTIPDGVKVIGPEAFSYGRIDRVEIPDTVEEIGSEAFCSCNIKEIDLPDSVKTIGAEAFWGAYIRSITLPSSVKEIPDSVFHGCRQLKDVYYDGTEKEWNNIAIGEENAELLDAVIHYLKVEETEKASDTEKTTESESISEENLSVDTVVNDATPPKPDNKPKYESKQTGDPIVTLTIISALALIIGTAIFAILAVKKRTATE